MGFDELDKAIDLRRRIAKWNRQAEEAQVALAAMERAAKLRPAGANGVRAESDHSDPDSAFFMPSTTIVGEDSRRPGRRPGAISADWRGVLSLLYFLGGTYTYAQIHDYAVKNKIDIDIASTRDRVRNFVKNELMSGTPDAGFEVTEIAAERFGFKESAPSENTPTGADKLEGE